VFITVGMKAHHLLDYSTHSARPRHLR
jgi:hypothetical protein